MYPVLSGSSSTCRYSTQRWTRHLVGNDLMNSNLSVNNEFATVNAGLKLGSNLAKHFKDFNDKGIIPIEDEEGSENEHPDESFLDESNFNHNGSNTIVPGSSVNEIPISEPSGREDSNSEPSNKESENEESTSWISEKEADKNHF